MHLKNIRFKELLSLCSSASKGRAEGFLPLFHFKTVYLKQLNKAVFLFYAVLMFTITQAQPTQAAAIAALIMEAMNYDCCLYFTGRDHTLNDFHQVMTTLVEAKNTQYSYQNTLVALNKNSEVIGVCVCYDGAQLHFLRQAFIQACRENFERDFSNMDDETAGGELYLDSLAVNTKYRGKGIAKKLLQAAIEKGEKLGLPASGLLVDKGNPLAERLYLSLGFEYIEDKKWGGHPMKHLQYRYQK